ncbi:MAG: hypothetical protein GYB67_16060, partial [Chloroflexi bacterium]|nr:hypothetical protein [Chloroflexota bacterium]
IDRLWALPVIMAVWGNLHAGFSIGFIFLAGFIAGEIFGNLFAPNSDIVVSWRRLRKVALVTAVSVAALVINPYGLQMLLVPFETVGIGALRQFIQEWNSPNFQERQIWPFVGLLFGLIGAVGASKLRLDWTDFLLASGTGFLALLAGRNIAVFAVVATPILTYHLASILTERGWVIRSLRTVSPRIARLNALLVGVVLIGAAARTLIVLDDETVQPAFAETLPIEAAAYIAAQQPAGPMFNSYNWGGYLLWALPDYPVFVDGRTDLYGDTFLIRYLQTTTARPGWRETLDEYGINLVVVENGGGLALQLREEPGWQLDYEDDLAALFVRTGGDVDG